MLAPCPTLTFISITLLVWQTHGFEETHATFLHTDLLKLLVKKCSKGTGFSKTWLLRDLEVTRRALCRPEAELACPNQFHPVYSVLCSFETQP